MSIEEKTVYVTRGQQFDSLEKAEAFRLDCIGKFMDKAPLLLGPRDRIKLADFIAANRAALIKLLSY